MIPVLPHSPSAGSAPSSGSGDRLAWVVALDRLELDLLKIERAADPADVPSLDQWDVPTVDGPIPHDLLDRALSLHRRQVAVAERLAESLASVQRQLEVTERISIGTSGSGQVSPAYVDVSA